MMIAPRLINSQVISKSNPPTLARAQSNDDRLFKALQNQCQYLPHQQRSPSRVARQSRELMATPKNENATDQLYQRITGVNQSLVFAILSECHVCVLFLH